MRRLILKNEAPHSSASALFSLHATGSAISEICCPQIKRLEQLRVAVCGGYVGDHVAVSRALGALSNFHFRTGKKVDGILSDPEVFYRQLEADLDFLLLASDGSFDLLKEQFAFTNARKGAT